MATIYTTLKSPVSVQTELTPRCNNICTYCYNAWRKDCEFEPELNLNEHLTMARKLVEADVFEDVLTGGEPLLRRDILYPLAHYLSSKGVDVKLNTNLVLITEDDCKQMQDNGIKGILGSLPSSDKEMYSRITQTQNYDGAIRGIELLVKHGLAPAINMVVMKENREQVYETGKFVHGLGAKGFCGTPASPSECSKRSCELNSQEIVETLDDLLRLNTDLGMRVDIVEPLPRCIIPDVEKYKIFLKKDCAAGKLTVAISSSGNIRPCTHVSQGYGNLVTEDLSAIWKMQLMIIKK